MNPASASSAIMQSRAAPWAGLIAGALGWTLHQQVLADMLHFDCHLGSAAAGLLALLGVGALIVAGAWVSLSSRRASGATPARQFVASLSVMAAAIFFFAVLLQTLATTILPGCAA
jgi:hypothetical protein